MTHTQLDPDFLNKKHNLVHEITGRLLDELENDRMSEEAGRELAGDVLEANEVIKTNEDLNKFLKYLGENYPFLEQLSKNVEVHDDLQKAKTAVQSEDVEKLKKIQDQLTKFSEPS